MLTGDISINDISVNDMPDPAELIITTVQRDISYTIYIPRQSSTVNQKILKKSLNDSNDVHRKTNHQYEAIELKIKKINNEYYISSEKFV